MTLKEPVLLLHSENMETLSNTLADEAMFSVGKLGKIVLGLAKTGLLNHGCGVDERKIEHLRA